MIPFPLLHAPLSRNAFGGTQKRSRHAHAAHPESLREDRGALIPRRSSVAVRRVLFLVGTAAVLSATLLATRQAPSQGAREARPPRHYIDLVAGSPDVGYRDGGFQHARFNGPAGIAASPDGKRLYVADCENHRIRAVHLDERNRVSTVAGSGRPGRVDGPAREAEFERPTLLALLPRDRIVVFDGALRLVDLRTGSVSTLLPASRLGSVWGLAVPKNGSVIYFSEPERGTIRALDVATRKVSTICERDPRLPQPGLLCIFQGDLCAADRSTGAVSRVRPGLAKASIEQIGTARHPRGLTASGDVLYALQGDVRTPLARVVPPGDVALLSLFGETLENSKLTMAPFLPIADGSPIGFVADPAEDRRLFLTSERTSGVVAVRDYGFLTYRAADSASPNGLLDFDYPPRKPPRTFRIMITGDSHIFSAERQDNSRWGGKSNRMEVLPKKLEALLNSMAALEDRPLDYQVLVVGQKGDFPWLWPYYEIPVLARRFDVDLVLLTICPHFSFDAYFEAPLSRLGIPERAPDPEYRLKPAGEKVPPGLCKAFFERARKKGLAKLKGTQVEFGDLQAIYTDPDLRPDVLEMYGRPIRLLVKELSPRVRTSLLYLPGASIGGDSIEHELWKEVVRRNGPGLVDLEPPFQTLRLSYYPFSELSGSDHLTGPGNALTALLLARELIRAKAIPF